MTMPEDRDRAPAGEPASPQPDRGAPVDRRRFLALGVGAFVVATLPRAAHALRGRRLVRRTVPVMGTIAEIAVVDGDVRHAEDAIDAALAELRRVDRTMSFFSRWSDVGRANAGAGAEAVEIGPETGLVLAEALRWAHASDGAFDPALGEASALWDVTHRHEPPPEPAYRRFAGRQLFRHVDLDRGAAGARVRYENPEIALDLGGIAKGHGVDLAVKALRERGVKDALVNVGGDLYALGRSERGDDWEIGVQSPTRAEGIIARFTLSDRAVATSGDYMRYFDWHGRRYHHLLDPATGAPRVTREHSVSVAAETCMAADAGATAVYGLPRAEADALLRRPAGGARVLDLA